jgi:hypothetical protein
VSDILSQSKLLSDLPLIAEEPEPNEEKKVEESIDDF